MAPGRFQFEPAEQREIEVVPKHGNVHLGKAGPYIVGLRIDASLQYQGAAGVLRPIEENIEARIGAAYGALDLSSGKFEQRTIERRAFLVEPDLLVQSAEAGDVIKGDRRVTRYRGGIAEKVYVRNVAGLGPGRYAGRRAVRRSRRQSPAERRRHSVF